MRKNKNNEFRKFMRVLGIKKRDGRIWVSKMYKGGKEERSDEKIGISPFVVEPAYVTFSEGVTLNIGNYQSVRIDVGISLPTYVNEIDDAFVVAKQIVNDRINKEIVEVRNEIKEVG